MASVLDPREQEGFSDRLDAFDDAGSASCALEDLLGRASDECRGPDLDDLTWLLDIAYNHFASGAIDEGKAALAPPGYEATLIG